MKTRPLVGVVLLAALVAVAVGAARCALDAPPGATEDGGAVASPSLSESPDHAADTSDAAESPAVAAGTSAPGVRRSAPGAKRSRAAAPRESDDDAGGDEEDVVLVPPPRKFNLRLVDAAGAPLAAAQVAAYRDDAREPYAAGATDAEGRITFEGSPFRTTLVVSRGALVSREIPVIGDDEDQASDVTVALSEAVVVRGIVVRPDGSPAEGLVVARCGSPDGYGALRRVVTGPGGEFSLPPVPRDDPREFVAAYPERMSPWVESIDRQAPEPFVRLEVPWLVDLTGTCVTEQGTPLGDVEGATTAATFERNSVRSPGSQTIVHLVGTTTWQADIAWSGPGPTIDLGAVVFRRSAPLSGVLFAPDGSPAADVHVSLIGLTGVTVVSDAQGRFAFNRASRLGEHLLVSAYLEVPPAADGTARPDVRAWTLVDGADLAAARRDDRELRVPLTVNPVARLRLRTASGVPIAPEGRLSVTLVGGADRSPRPEIEGSVVSFALVGPPPWPVSVELAGYREATVRFEAGDSLERDVVLAERIRR